MKNIINLIREKIQLNNRFGNLSCFDYPAEYVRMDEISEQVQKQIEALTHESDISASGLLTALENIAEDMEQGNIAESVSIALYTQDEFIQCLTKTMMRKESERFVDMLNWMQEKDRAGYLETRFILVFENDRNDKRSFYHDERMSFVIIVG